MSLSQNLKKALRVLAPFGIIVGILVLFVYSANQDLYARLTQTEVAQGMGLPLGRSDQVPTVRLVLHRLLPDENVVEVSMFLSVDSGRLARAIADGRATITATIRDGYLLEPYGITHSVTLNASTAGGGTGAYSVAAESVRFLLPAAPSVAGFPFDDVDVRPILGVTVDGADTNAFRYEVQKAFPGRLIKLTDENIPSIILTRSPTEKAIVLAASAIFVALSLVLVFAVFSATNGLTTLNELVAVGGYLVAAAGFREILGISRASGTTALEVFVIGIPLLLLTSAVAISFVRGLLSTGKTGAAGGAKKGK